MDNYEQGSTEIKGDLLLDSLQRELAYIDRELFLKKTKLGMGDLFLDSIKKYYQYQYLNERITEYTKSIDETGNRIHKEIISISDLRIEKKVLDESNPIKRAIKRNRRIEIEKSIAEKHRIVDKYDQLQNYFIEHLTSSLMEKEEIETIIMSLCKRFDISLNDLEDMLILNASEESLAILSARKEELQNMISSHTSSIEIDKTADVIVSKEFVIERILDAEYSIIDTINGNLEERLERRQELLECSYEELVTLYDDYYIHDDEEKGKMQIKTT